MSQDGDTADSADEKKSESPSEGEDPTAKTVEVLAGRLDALSTQVNGLRGRLDEARSERDELREEVEDLRAENVELRQQIARLDARTALLELVDTADTLDGEQRSVALIQHLKRAAERQQERGRSARSSVTRTEAEAALHHPDVDRTTIYDDMRRAARLVGDESVLWCESSSGGDSRLKLDLEAGSLPSEVVGRQTSNGGQ